MGDVERFTLGLVGARSSPPLRGRFGSSDRIVERVGRPRNGFLESIRGRSRGVSRVPTHLALVVGLLAAVGAFGCSAYQTGLGPGAACVRSAQCQGGLVCNMGMCTSDLAGFGMGMPPVLPDGGPPDALVDPDAAPPEMDAGPPIDAAMPPLDAPMPPPDSFVPPPDSFVPPLDAFVPATDAFVEPDAFVALDAS